MKVNSKKEVSGWLVSPEGDWCYRFHRDASINEASDCVIVDKWSAQCDGRPLQMKTSSKLPLDEALELCGEMLLDGWQKLTNQFGDEPNIETKKEVTA